MPNPDRVLLRKSTDGRYVEVGVLVERIKGKTWRLVLPDGSEVDHDIQPSEAFPERGSIAHRLRVDPEGVASALDTSPEDVFMEVLSTFPKGAKAAQLKDALTSLDRRLVDKSWERARRKLDASPDVKRSDAKIPTYRLLTSPGPRVSTDENLSPKVSPATSSDPSPSASTVESLPSTSSPDDQGQDASSQETRATPDHEDFGAEPTDPLLRFLVRAGLTDSHESLSSLARQPLKLGQLLGRVKAADISELLPSLDEPHRRLLATVLGAGKEALLASDFAKVSKDEYEAALRAGMVEVARAPKEKGRLPQLLALLERATTSHTMSLHLLVDIARTYADEARRREQPRERRQLALAGLQKALESVARAFETSDHDFAEIDTPRLAEAARQASFARTGGRSFLLATLYRKVPERAKGDAWWAGATFDQLVEAGHGPLATALNDDTIAERVVRPLVDAALDQVETRSRLGQIISAPAPLARWVSGEKMKDALLRTGNRDEVASTWADVLTDSRELARMEDRLSAARHAVGASEGKQRDLEQRIARLEHRLQVTGEELAAARATQGEARGVHERQVRADLVRVLAKIAAQVSQSAAASQDDGLMRTIRHAAAREGLNPIGTVGHRAAFDPSRHDPMGQAISSDTHVTVVRPGYTWTDGTESFVLLKAQVVSNGE